VVFVTKAVGEFKKNIRLAFSLLTVSSNLAGSSTKTHLELRNIAVEEFLEMLRFEQRGKRADLVCEAGFIHLTKILGSGNSI